MAYCVGRCWIEYLRVDTANHLFGVRVNVFTSVVLFLLALAFFVVQGRRHPGRQVAVPVDAEPVDADRADEDRADEDRADEDRVDLDPDDETPQPAAEVDDAVERPEGVET
jgi:hypothetical protein